MYKSKIEFFKDFIYDWGIAIRTISKNCIPKDIDFGLRYSIGLENEYKNLFDISKFPENSITKINDNFTSNYFFIPLYECEENKIMIVGPYITKPISNKDIESDCASLSLLPHAIENIQNYFNTVPCIDDKAIDIAVNCLSKVLFNKKSDFQTQKINYDDVFDASFHIRKISKNENDSPIASIQAIENAYELENKLLIAISQGLAHKAEAVFGNIKPSAMLEDRFSDKLRNTKNFMIVLNTLARKAVEQGGVHPIYIDGISTDLSLKIENAPTINECDKLFFEIINKYSLLVQQHSQKGYSLLVQRVITSVDTDITADLSLKNMAKLLNVNPSYLSTLFKKETGVTLTDYVNKRRIDRAKSLLKSGDLQIQAVAQNCGMVDVNYFTKLFKKYTGVTPKEYKKS